MILRDYQQAAIETTYNWMRYHLGNPCIEIPTGGGKTPILATMASDVVAKWNGRSLVVSHVKELLEQSHRHLQELCPEIPIGLYSASLGARDTMQPVIVGGIQSIYKKTAELGVIDLMLIDECHLLSQNSDGMYQTLISDLREINPDMRVVGLTATPYRMDSGPICGPESIMSEIVFRVGVRDLIQRGYLCKLVGRAAIAQVNTASLSIVRGEFDLAEAEHLFMPTAVVFEAVRELCIVTKSCQSVLVFCQSVAHANLVAKCIREYTDEAVGEIYSDTDDALRDTLIKAFKEQQLKWLVNVNVLTTGFDAPCIDCVAILRATESAGLYYQMVGRGFRLFPGKSHTLVLDFGQNIERHGPVDLLEPRKKGGSGKAAKRENGGKVCPDCRTVNSYSTKECTECCYPFPQIPIEAEHGSKAGNGEPVSDGKPIETVVEHEVTDVTFKVHVKKDNPNAPRTMRVEYQLSMTDFISEWVCFEHGGFAMDKAFAWWKKHSGLPFPACSAEAVILADTGKIKVAGKIKVKRKKGSKFPEIVEHNDLSHSIFTPSRCSTHPDGKMFVDDNPYGPHQGSLRCSECREQIRWMTQNELDGLKSMGVENKIIITLPDHWSDPDNVPVSQSEMQIQNKSGWDDDEIPF